MKYPGFTTARHILQLKLESKVTYETLVPKLQEPGGSFLHGQLSLCIGWLLLSK
jgi:hypothetical protein